MIEKEGEAQSDSLPILRMISHAFQKSKMGWAHPMRATSKSPAVPIVVELCLQQEGGHEIRCSLSCIGGVGEQTYDVYSCIGVSERQTQTSWSSPLRFSALLYRNNGDNGW